MLNYLIFPVCFSFVICKAVIICYFHVECGAGIGDSGCGTRQHFTSDCGQIIINQGPNPGSVCQWYIEAAQGQKINLEINKFDIEDSGKDLKTTFFGTCQYILSQKVNVLHRNRRS